MAGALSRDSAAQASSTSNETRRRADRSASLGARPPESRRMSEPNNDGNVER